MARLLPSASLLPRNLKNGCRIVQRTQHLPLFPHNGSKTLCVPVSGSVPRERVVGCWGTENNRAHDSALVPICSQILGKLYKTASMKMGKRLAGVKTSYNALHSSTTWPCLVTAHVGFKTSGIWSPIKKDCWHQLLSAVLQYHPG